MSGCSIFMEEIMKPIELEKWEPKPEDPRYLRYVGQPVAEEVFHALEQRLKDAGSLPDEYFLMDIPRAGRSITMSPAAASRSSPY